MVFQAMSTTSPASKSSSQSAFSLLEVVIALGVVSVALVSVLAIMPALFRESRAVSEIEKALSLADGVTVELKRVGSSRGWSALASIEAEGSTWDRGLLLVASRDGASVRELGSANPDRRDEYFLIDVRTFPTGNALAFDAGSGYAAFAVRVSWPYRAHDSSAATSPSDRRFVTYTVSLTR